MTRRAGGWLALAATLMALAGRPALAQEVKVGKIDMDRVQQEYKLFKTMSDEFRAMGQKLMRQLDERHRLYPLLIDDEWNQLVEIKTKGETASAQEKQTLARLERLSNERDKEIADLQAVADNKLTEQQRQRRKELQDLQTKAAEHFTEMQKRYDALLREKDKELSTQLEKNINGAIEVVAKEQGLSVVLRKDSILFGGIDITDALVAKLNAEPAPAPGG